MRKLITALVFTAFSTFSQAQYALKEVKTPSGIRLVHYLLKDEKVQSLAFYWREREVQHHADKAGMLYLAPQVLLSGGSVNLDGGALSEDFKDMDAFLNFSRSASLTRGSLSAPPDRFGEAAALLKTLLSNPKFPQKHLERQKRSLLANVKAADEKPDNLARRMLERYVTQGTVQARWLLLEPQEGISAVSRDDLIDWHSTIFARSNLTVVAAGPLDFDTVQMQVEAAFSTLPQNHEPKARLPFAPAPKPKTILIERDVPQSVVIMGAPSDWIKKTYATPRGLALSILGSGYASRLNQVVREKLGATYGVSASLPTLANQVGLFSMQSSVSHDKLPQALEAIAQTYAEYRTKGITEQELTPLKARFKAQRLDVMGKAMPSSELIRTMLTENVPLKDLDLYVERLDALTPEMINEEIRRYLPEQLITVIVTPSAAGLKADCVLKSVADLSSCQ